MRYFCFQLLILCLWVGCSSPTSSPATKNFMRVNGVNLIDSTGNKFFIQGTNLGNWLNPEGYMFRFQQASSPTKINQMFCELVGPDFTAQFWSDFKDHYITEKDITFIASTGANTIRLPLHYKLFTEEDYMGLTHNQDGFQRIDQVIEWCRKEGLYLILEIHDAPGGQTGDNIDDSYGYPWLFESETSQALFCSIWQRIADYYKDEPLILGYELMNEPIAPYFDNMEELNQKLEPLYKRAVAAIRVVDSEHIILLGGAQWNGNFNPFTDASFDKQLMYTCHRYGGEPTSEAIASFIHFRDSVQLPMYMGEIGHNTEEWQEQFCRTLITHNIGYTFWPYKKMDGSCFTAITAPTNWSLIVDFAESPRATFDEVRKARPNQKEAQKVLQEFIENCKWENCKIQEGYIRSLLLNNKLH